jgi:hypothetical protein
MNATAERRLLLLGALLVGFALRLGGLDHDSFWSDEAGQVLAARQPTLMALVEAMRVHVMAMPLDYLVTRAMTGLGSGEFLLRFPAVVWGTLALPLWWVLVRRASSPTVAGYALWLLALMPLHVRYSQEVRFYALLVTAYLVALWLLYRALARPSRARWAGLGLALISGVYVHPYVALALVPGGVYVALLRRTTGRWTGLWGLVGMGLLTVAAYWFGARWFSGPRTVAFTLNQFGGNVPENLLVGLGALAYPYLPDNLRFGVWEAVQVVGAVVGGVWLVRHRRAHPMAVSLVVGALLQIGLILAGDWVGQYPFVARQILPFATALLLLTALGLAQLEAGLIGRGLSARWATVGLLLLVGGSAVGPLTDQAAYPRGNGRAVMAALGEQHQPGTPVYILPGFEAPVYELYAQTVPGAARVTPDLRRATWDEVREMAMRADCPRMVVAPLTDRAALDGLVEAGFVYLLRPDLAWSGNRALLWRACP